MRANRRKNCPDFFLRDSNETCNRGCQELNDGIDSKTRRVKVQTLKDGVLEAFVKDFQCKLCGTEVPFDGLEFGLFCASKRWIICRDVLDISMYNVACVGLILGNFMKAFGICWKQFLTQCKIRPLAD